MKITFDMPRGAYRILALLIHSSQNEELVEEYIEDAEEDNKDPGFSIEDLEFLQNLILDITSDPLPDKKKEPVIKAKKKKGRK